MCDNSMVMYGYFSSNSSPSPFKVFIAIRHAHLIQTCMSSDQGIGRKLEDDSRSSDWGMTESQCLFCVSRLWPDASSCGMRYCLMRNG